MHIQYRPGLLLFLMLVLLRNGLDLQSQSFFFDNYSTQQEFDSKVYCIIQDKDHYVWMGTPSGVWRYDGMSFVKYTEEDGLAEGSVRALFIDRQKDLWIGHEGGGLSRYNGRTFEQITLLDSILRSNITSIRQDKDNQLWITTESDGALVIKNPEKPAQFLEFEHFLKGKSLGDQVFSSLLTSDSSIYFITNVGIRKYNKKENSFISYLPKGLSTYFSISVMFEDSKGNLWFGTYNGGLSILNPHDGSFQYYLKSDGLASNWITSITEDRVGNVWIGHWKDDVNTGGITRIGPSGKIQVFNTANGLHDDHIWCITQDHQGNLLIGTTDQGLEIFKGEKFVSITTKDGLIHNQVNAITEGLKGEIWFGTNQGITVYIPDDKKPLFSQFNQNNKFISNQIGIFKKDNNNNIWIGTKDQGIVLYNTTRKQFVSQPRVNSYLPYYQTLSKGISALEISKDGHLWIGTIEGLVEYDIKNDAYVATYTQGSGLAGNEITALFLDSRGNLWIGAGKNKGLTRIKNREFTIIKEVGEITPTCMTEDKEGNIWIGTDSKGIFVLNHDSISQYGVGTGLLSNHINLLFCDVFNNIYVGSNRGLNKIDRKNNKILSYSGQVGFTGIETKPNAWFLDSKGYLWIGTANGAMRCDINMLAKENIAKPSIRITDIMVKGSSIDILRTKRFSSGQNDFNFIYSSISFTNPDAVTFQSTLEGYDDTWQDQRNENSRTYVKLPPGKYIFKVRARNEYGEWTIDPAEFNFRILAPPYKRGYFIFTVICILLASIVAFIKIRERNLVHEKKVLEARVTERTQALQVANTELSMKNKDILDSITYAKRIQLAILPSEIMFDETFILYKPKDIVSGDFYWMYSTGGREFIAAVDCTGHGVPGAFMSFIGYTSLNMIIIEQGIYKPSAILDRLNEEVAAMLHQKGEAIVNDGMDISLICYTPETKVVEYSGAFNPLIIIRESEIIEIKADRLAIGRSVGGEKKFANHEFQLEAEDSIYMFSDGFADQFGGPEGKKFKTSALKELLLNIHEYDAETQLKILDSSFEDWKGKQEQIDDVLVFGRKV